MSNDLVISQPRAIAPVIGSGGGKGGSGKGGTETPNTLRSRDMVNVVELLGEGPIKGLVDSAFSIYFDSTPLVNRDGSVNYPGVEYEFRSGLPDQPELFGNPTAETTFQVDQRARARLDPVVRTVAETNADAVRVIVRIPALAYQDKKTGNILATSVAYAFEAKSNTGVWTRMVTHVIANEKCTSPFHQSHTFDLPPGGAPWQIRMIRLTPDADTVELSNETWWATYSVIVRARLTYPNSALMRVRVNAELFGGGSVPTRFYEVDGLIIQVPSNYDPISRVYDGIWNGSFKLAWTNNPAWVLYDLLVNDRYGIGEFVDAAKVDKWSLYQIAQYCDQLVPDGSGHWEPRFTFNATLNSRDEAYKVLQNVTAAFRGMAFWSLGQVFATADMPDDPVKLVSPANVIDGQFSYSGTSMKARHSVALVTWNDPSDYYRPAIEVVQNDAAINRFGWRQVEVQAFGCTSRGQAHRYGKWILDSEFNETETVTYEASFDHIDVRPGHLIAVADPGKARARAGGRVAAATTLKVKLDAPFEPAAGQTYKLMVELPDGKLETRNIASIDALTGYVEVNLVTPFSIAPQVGAMWAVTGTDIAPRLYRVLHVRESEANTCKITALFHDPTKFARVEQNITLPPIAYTRPLTHIKPPINGTARESLFWQDSLPRSRIMVSWTPADDFMSKSYSVGAATPDGWRNFGEVSTTSIDINDSRAGDYVFYITANGIRGGTSTPLEIPFTALGWEGIDPPFVSHLEVVGRAESGEWGGPDCQIAWRNNFPGTAVDLGSQDFAGEGQENPFYRDNIVRVFDVELGVLVHEQSVRGHTFTYTYAMNHENSARFGRGPQRALRFEVTVRDTLGRESKQVRLLAENPTPDLIIPTVAAGVSSVFVDYVLPLDLDLAGAVIWMSRDRNFPLDATTQVYDGVNNFLSLPCEPFTTYYVRMGAYDLFGRDGMNVCPPIEVTSSGVFIDREPPAVPTGLSLYAFVETLDTGEVRSVLRAQWNESPSENFSAFEIETRRAGGNWLQSVVGAPLFERPGVIPLSIYDVRVRARSINGVTSNWCETVSLEIPAKEIGPGTPTSLTASASLRSAFLKWTNPSDPDIQDIEIWMYEGASADFSNALLMGRSQTNAFTVSGLTTGQKYWFWVRARNTSGLLGSTSIEASVTPGQVGEGDIAANSIYADAIQAQAITGDHLNIASYLPPTMVIGTTGVTVGGTTNPAALINANTTVIQPGRITISGDTTLADWRSGTDQTQINGGFIAANSIAANVVTIGLRGIDVAGLQFSYDKTTNRLSWTAGSIVYVNDAGTTVSVSVDAGFHNHVTGTTWIGWEKGATSLTAAASASAVSGANWIRLASYRGGNDLVANYGRTIIDGANIYAESITANQLYTGELITNNAQIKGGIIQDVHLAGNITFDKMGGGTLSTADRIRIGGDRFLLLAQEQQLVIKDGQGYVESTPYLGLPGRTRVKLGKFGTGTSDYGLQLWDAAGNYVLGSGGFGSGVIPAGAIQNIDMSQVLRLGSFAGVNSLNASNIGTYIAGAAIGDAYIGNLNGAKIWAGSITADQLSTGRLIAHSAQIGDLVVDNLHVKNGAISQVAAAQGGLTATVGMNVRGGNVAIFGWYSGNQGTGLPNISSWGTLNVYRDGGLIRSVNTNTDAFGSGYFLLQTSTVCIDSPGAGYHEFTVNNTNAAGLGFVNIVAIELAK